MYLDAIYTKLDNRTLGVVMNNFIIFIIVVLKLICVAGYGLENYSFRCTRCYRITTVSDCDNRLICRKLAGNYNCEFYDLNGESLDSDDDDDVSISCEDNKLSCEHSQDSEWNCKDIFETDSDTESDESEQLNYRICSIDAVSLSRRGRRRRRDCCVEINGICRNREMATGINPTNTSESTTITTTSNVTAAFTKSKIILAVVLPELLSGLVIIVIIIIIASIVFYKLRNKQTETKASFSSLIRNAYSSTVNTEETNRANAIDNPLESNNSGVYCEITQNINPIETVGNTNQNQDDGPQYGLIINELYAGFVEGEVPNARLYEELSLPKSQTSATDSLVSNPLYYASARYRRASQSSNLYVEPPVSLPELESGLRSCPFEIKLRELSIGAQFASGHFGVVYRATYRTGRGDMPVAVKTLRESANPDTMVAFMTEAATLAQFSHPNVLRLMGVVTAQQPWMIVTELLKTELRELLIKLKDFPQNAILPSLLFKFSCEIAAGMQYLSGINFIHRDLAARNVLVAKDMTIRVADFGMSREVVPESDYYTASGGTVPLRWTAPEAVLYKKFSEKSDVWSYGMTLVEIWTLGDKPWGECTNEEIIEALTIGGSPPPPSGCPQELSTVMRECWRSDKNDRPTFSELVRQLSGISIPVIPPN